MVLLYHIVISLNQCYMHVEVQSYFNPYCYMLKVCTTSTSTVLCVI